MRKLLIMTASFSLFACSTVQIEMKYTNKSPGGITISNIVKEKQSRAYQIAESHCAKYNKVPRITKTVIQASYDDSQKKMRTTDFECVRP